ncbi:MAG: cytochrome C peroxidase [Halieaceae bacterium]|nr:cytochrome C peroxidase [Halieaceae bacterium]
MRDREIPSIESALAQLGKTLFFSKSLGGGFDSACVTCHHPSLGGADGLALSVGVGALSPDLLGPGREHSSGLPLVPRNAPTVFNVALWDRGGLFWDSRVEPVRPRNGQPGGIRTPDSSFGEVDPNAGDSLATAQSRFPVTSSGEMKTEAFESGSDNNQIRTHLAARLGDYGVGSDELPPSLWVQEFQQGFQSTLPAEDLVTFANIATAIGAYERSMVLVNNPWKNYIEGDSQALSEAQKRGAVLFFTSGRQGGADCVSCHRGDFFTDQQHHNVAFPQFGPGKGDGADGAADFGRARETGRDRDQFDFRTPSLLNVALSAPYGHAGAYQTLEQVIRHYDNPREEVERLFRDGGACSIAQFEQVQDCLNLYPGSQAHSEAALANLEEEQRQGRSRLRRIRLDNNDIADIEAFLHALTDPCTQNRTCLAPWIADPTSHGPDGKQLNAIDAQGNPL